MSALLVLGVAGCARGEPSGAAAASVVIDGSKRFQTLEGWEVTLRGWEEDKANDRYDPTWFDSSEEAVDRLVEEAGVNRVRLEIGSAAEADVDYWKRFRDGEETYSSWSQIRYANHNDNGDPMVADPAGFHWTAFDENVEALVLPMQAALAARDEKLFINLCVVDFGKRRGGVNNPGALDLAAEPKEYAELVVETFKRLKSKYGLTPDSLELMLEPENAQNWTPPRLAAAAKAAKARLAAEGFAPQIIGPSTVKAKNALRYFEAAERAGVDIDVLSYHSYDRPDDALRRTIAARAAKASTGTAMLEHLRADVIEFYADMTAANVSAWQQWGIAGRADNGNYLFVGRPQSKKGDRLTLSRRARLLSEIWRHARIGDTRVAASSADPGLRPLAFLKPDGRAVVSLIVDGPREITLTGLPAGEYSVERTTEAEFAEDVGDMKVGADGRAKIGMTARGVVTIYPARH
ncbi:MAG: hypothetical protein R3C58_10025 [Parvularculaceae bacterium]